MALDTFRATNIVWDGADKTIYENIQANSSDENGRKLVVHVVERGQAKPLSGVILSLYWQDKNGDNALDAFNSVDSSRGIFELYYTTAMLSHVGHLKANLVLNDSTGRIVSEEFTIKVNPGMDGNASTPSDNEVSLITHALAEIGKYDSKFNDLEIKKANKSDVKDTFSEISAQLTHIHYDVIAEGAKGDGVTDDTLVLQSILDKLRDGDSVFFPNRIFRTTDTLIIKKTIKVEMLGTILCDHDKVGILLKNDDVQGNFSSRNTLENTTLEIELAVSRVRGKGYENRSTAIGIEIWNAYYGTFKIKKVMNNYVGMKIIGSKYGSSYGGSSYNKFYLTYMSSYKTNIYFYSNGADGYVTQNQFYSGSLTGGESEGTVHILMENAGIVMNENVFFGTSFEGNFYTAFKAIRANSNRFNDCRFEMPKIQYLFHYTSSRFNQILNGYGVDSHMRSMKYDNNSSQQATVNKENYVNFIDYKLGHVEFFDDIFYIKPLQNYVGRFSDSNNGVSLGSIPKEWKTELIKDGLSDTFTYVNSENATTTELTLRIDFTDKIIISENRNQFPISTIILDTPPSHSKEGYLQFRYPSTSQLNILPGESIDAVVNKSGDSIVIPLGTTLVKYLYEHFSKTIYILDIW